MAIDGEHSESQDTSMSHFEQMDLVAKIFISLIIIVIISIFVYGFLRLCYNACCGDCSEWRSPDGTYLPSYNRRNRHRLDGGEDGGENCSEVDHIGENRGSGRVRGAGGRKRDRRDSDDSVLQNELKGIQRNLIPKVKNSKPKQKRKSLSSESSSNSSYEEEPENEEEDVEVDEGEPENEGKAESEEEEGKVEEAEGKDEAESEEEEPEEEHEEEPQEVPEEGPEPEHEPEPEPEPEPEIEVEFDCGGD